MSIPGGLGWRQTVAAPATGVAAAGAPIARPSAAASPRPADPTRASNGTFHRWSRTF
ncbi:hypothetical protein [Hamadaea tsunoensis]|uniref:hypothetical protein n=1 Tax=Hamadaea tsunoensis TaxID=53368 RepID=UPI000421FFE6|nr:hypothetical protein [Hamadaea tsunoensis]